MLYFDFYNKNNCYVNTSIILGIDKNKDALHCIYIVSKADSATYIMNHDYDQLTYI